MIAAALAGGVKAVQLREKDLPLRDLLSLAQCMRELTSKNSALLLINDRTDICQAVDADGVHLRSDSFPTHVVRRILGDHKRIGVSVHSVQEAVIAENEGADFVTLGPLYETPSKIPYGRPLGLKILRAARERIRIPLFALGGIRAEHVAELFSAGADGMALISSILSSEDPKKAAQDLIRAVHRHCAKQ